MNTTTFSAMVALARGASAAGEILEIIASLPGTAGPPSLASFYRALKGAIDEGWIEDTGTAEPTRGAGRPPLRYRLTASGQAAMREEAHRLRLLAANALDPMPADRNLTA